MRRAWTIGGLVSSLALFALCWPAQARRAIRSTARSVKVYKGPIRVRTRPFVGAPLRGLIVPAGRFPVHKVFSPGKGCKERWYQLGPEAYACSGWLLPRKQAATSRKRLEVSWRPGPFFGVQATRRKRLHYYPNLRRLSRGRPWRLRGDVGLEVHSRLVLASRTYLVGRTGGLVAARTVTRYPGSSLLGVAVRQPRDLPLAIALRQTPLLKRTSSGGLIATTLRLKRYGVRQVKRVLTVNGQAVAQVSRTHFVHQRDVALAVKPPAPPAGTGAKERWVDVDAAQRLVFAMRGSRVVRVMLASLGPATPQGVFRVEQKRVYKDMIRRHGDRPYFLEAVPYPVFFKGDFALHGAYWHDAFGTQVSHGCVNLPLADARFVFDWLGPTLPAGYFAIWPTSKDLGGRVRVRNTYRYRQGEPRPAKRRRRPARRR